MSEKVAKLGISRDKDFMYYVKDGAVWKVQRKQPGVPKGRPEKVADGGVEMDTNYIYFVDRDGDVARAKRAVGGQKRKKTAKKAAKPPKPVSTTAAITNNRDGVLLMTLSPTICRLNSSASVQTEPARCAS
jgi:hypothetical protein